MTRLTYSMYNMVLMCILWSSPALTALGQLSPAVSVDINLNVKHVVGSESTFAREKYITLHAGLTDGDWDSDAQRTQFLNDYDVYLGRNNGSLPWNLSQTKEDSSKPGWADEAHMQTRGKQARDKYASKSSVHQHEWRADNSMIGGQPSMYPNGQLNGKGWAIGDYNALAEYFTDYLTHFHGSGGIDGEAKPTVVEVMNEPFVHANDLGTTRANISELHRVVATRIKQDHPDVLVGGYTAAHPQYEGNGFGHWDANWKTYIDTAGSVTDFYSLHLYDNYQNAKNASEVQYRSGSNVEAILDMVEHYSWLKLGEVKPFNISEYGALPVNGDQPYSRQTDWENLSAYNKIHMQLLERSNNVMMSMPFMILKAEWGRNPISGNPYTSRILRQKFEGEGETGNEWVYTDLVKFYELWSEVNGIRVDTHASDPDIQVDTYVDGKTAYVILNSLDHTADRTLDLNILGSSGNTLEGLSVKHLYADVNGVAVLDDYSVNPSTINANGLFEVSIGSSATMILKCDYRQDLAINQTATESKYYAHTYLQPIVANAAVNFQVNSVARRTATGEAILRLGLGRDHGRSLKPQLLVNGYEVEVPENWRGYDQSSRSSFFGVLEIPVPYAYLKWNNTISVTFPDAGGHVSSMSMQVFEFSETIERHSDLHEGHITAEQIEIVTGTETVSIGGTHRPLVYVSPADASDPTLSWTTSDASIASVSTAGLVSGISSGNALITARATDGSIAGQYTVTVGDSAPKLQLTDYNAYAANTYYAGGTLDVSAVYDAGAGNVIANTKGGIRYLLREVTSSWSVVKDYVVDDVIAIGTQCGASVGSIPLPGDLLPSSELPAGNFYFLFVTMNVDDASSSKSIGISNIQIERSTPLFQFDDISNYKNKSFVAGTSLDVTTFYDAGSGYAVTAAEGGIRYMLREVTQNWKVVKDYVVTDANALGTQMGVSRVSIPLPADMPASRDLPLGNFYFLFALYETQHPSAGGQNMAIGLQPVIIEQSTPTIKFDDKSKYLDQRFTVGSTLDVATEFDAGSGATVNTATAGIRYMLREVNSSWQVIKDYVADDMSVIGHQAGSSSASIVLPPDTAPSDSLPAGHFYYLFAILGTDHVDAVGGRESVGLSPVIIQSR